MSNPITLTNPVMKATQTKDNNTFIGRFGANATDVQVQIQNQKYNLQNYINALDDYFSNSSFMYYGTIPTGKQLPNQVKFWYDTSN